MVAGSAAYYHDNTATKNLWLAGVGSMVLIFPWTKFVMLPDIKRLLKDNVIEERGNLKTPSKLKTRQIRVSDLTTHHTGSRSDDLCIQPMSVLLSNALARSVHLDWTK